MYGHCSVHVCYFSDFCVKSNFRATTLVLLFINLHKRVHVPVELEVALELVPWRVCVAGVAWARTSDLILLRWFTGWLWCWGKRASWGTTLWLTARLCPRGCSVPGVRYPCEKCTRYTPVAAIPNRRSNTNSFTTRRIVFFAFRYQRGNAELNANATFHQKLGMYVHDHFIIFLSLPDAWAVNTFRFGAGESKLGHYGQGLSQEGRAGGRGIYSLQE